MRKKRPGVQREQALVLCPRCGTTLPEGSRECSVCLVAERAPEARGAEQQVWMVEGEQITPAPLSLAWRRLAERLATLLASPGRRRLARAALSLALLAVVLLVSVGAWRAFVGSLWGVRLRGMNEIVFVGTPMNPLASQQTNSAVTLCNTSTTTPAQSNWVVQGSTDCTRQTSGGTAPNVVERRALAANGGLYLMRPDGSGLHRLSALPKGTFFSPAWSPDGAHIAAFVRAPASRFVVELIVMDADGSNARLIPAVSLLIGSLTGGFSEVATPLARLISWSPDGSRLVAPIGSGQFALLNADGSGLRQFNGILPAWSPDGRSLAYYIESQASASAAIGASPPSPYSDPLLRIEILNTQIFQTQDLRALPNLSGSALAWSPDGRFLAYSAVRQDAGQALPTGVLMLARVDGSDPRVVGQWQGSLVDQIAWSPNGEQIAVVLGEAILRENANLISTVQELSVVAADGSHLRDLGASDGAAPSWSPDGQHLIFASPVDSFRSSVLLVADVAAAPLNLRQLSAPLPFAFAPCWSPLAGI